jgi:hypothetical protein
LREASNIVMAEEVNAQSDLKTHRVRPHIVRRVQAIQNWSQTHRRSRDRRKERSRRPRWLDDRPNLCSKNVQHQGKQTKSENSL